MRVKEHKRGGIEGEAESWITAYRFIDSIQRRQISMSQSAPTSQEWYHHHSILFYSIHYHHNFKNSPAGCALTATLVHVKVTEASDSCDHVNWLVENSHCSCPQSRPFRLHRIGEESKGKRVRRREEKKVRIGEGRKESNEEADERLILQKEQQFTYYQTSCVHDHITNDKVKDWKT